MELIHSTFEQINKDESLSELQLSYNNTMVPSREKKQGISLLLINISNKLCLSSLIYQK
jgi:hypothetical protein